MMVEKRVGICKTRNSRHNTVNTKPNINRSTNVIDNIYTVLFGGRDGKQECI